MMHTKNCSPIILLIFVLVLVGEVTSAQKLYVSPSKKITYDTTFNIIGLTTSEIFNRTKDWFTIRDGYPRTRIISEEQSSRITGNIITSYPAGLGTYVTYINDINVTIDNQTVNVTIDNMATSTVDGVRKINIEFSGLKKDGTMRTAKHYRNFNTVIENDLTTIIAGLFNYIISTPPVTNLADTISYNQQYDTSVKHFTSSKKENTLFYFRGGVSCFLALDQSNANDPGVLPGYTFAPGLRLFKNDIAAITASIPLTIGGIRGGYYGFDLPGMFDIHIGSTAVDNSTLKFGFIVGIGKSYFLGGYSSSDHVVQIWGTRYQLGLSIGKKQVSERNVIMLSYEKGGSNFSIFGLSLQAIF